MEVNRDALRDEARNYATARFRGEVQGVAIAAYLEATEALIQKMAQMSGDEITERLSHAYSNLKSIHWEIKLQYEESLRENRKLRHSNNVLRENYFDIVQRWNERFREENAAKAYAPDDERW